MKPPYVVPSPAMASDSTLFFTVGPSWMSYEQDIEKMQTLAVIYIVTSILSLLFTPSILGAGSIVVAIFVKRRVTSSELRPMFHLSLADFIASVTLLAGTVLYNYKYNTIVKGKVLCSYFTALASSFYISTFLLTVVYAGEVYVKLKSLYPRMRNTRQTRERRDEVFGSFYGLYFMYSFSWALPLAVTFCLFGIDSGEQGNGSLNDDICGTCLPVFHYKSDNCSIAASRGSEPDWNEIYKYIFLAVLFVSMLAVVIIYILAIRLFQRLQKSGGIIGREQYKREAQVRRRAYVYQLAFISCWLPCFILGILSLADSFKMKNYYALYIIQAVVSPLQGF